MKKNENRYYGTPFEGMTAKERYSFARFLTLRGANFRTMLDRIMYRGYAEWECVGIREIVQDFTDKEMSPRHLLSILEREERLRLFDKLTSMGMCRRTARHRFSVGTFKEWELIGINALYEEWRQLGEASPS